MVCRVSVTDASGETPILATPILARRQETYTPGNTPILARRHETSSPAAAASDRAHSYTGAQQQLQGVHGARQVSSQADQGCDPTARPALDPWPSVEHARPGKGCLLPSATPTQVRIEQVDYPRPAPPSQEKGEGKSVDKRSGTSFAR
jgi:hypothetical protein